eukprot:1033530-Karenia_brevis.AAC.1
MGHMNEEMVTGAFGYNASVGANRTDEIMPQSSAGANGANHIMPQSSSLPHGTNEQRDGDMCFWIQCIRWSKWDK